MTSAALFSVLHVLLLAAFVGGTALALLAVIVKRLRIRRPRLVWHKGAVTTVPLGPSLFLVLVAGGLTYAVLTGSPVPISVALGYPAGGGFWLAATWIARSVVVSDYGLVHALSLSTRAIGWGQIVDYVATRRDGQPHFVFFYRDENGGHRRLDLPVPEADVDAFRELVQAKLDTRFASAATQAYGEEVLDRPSDLFGRS